MKLNKLAFFIAATMSTSVFAVQSENPLADQPFANKTESGYDLNFNGQNYREGKAVLDGKEIKFRAFEKIVYVQNPVEPEYQTINFYVPEGYFHQEKINGFDVDNAPIFLPNAIGGYMPAIAATAEQKGIGGKPSTILTALSKGYIVASVGARGRTLGSEGNYTGKAPAAIIDLKAAVRYLHANDDKMPGDANKIISNGTSAGGAMSALLGTSANQAEFEPYFKALGAAQAKDTIFAVSAYCPITNLEHADMAYEWEFNGLNEFSRMDMSKLTAADFNDRSKSMPMTEGTLTDKQIVLSNQLKAAFPAYLNSLNLKDARGKSLTLNEQGDGSFKNYIIAALVQSANKAIEDGTDLTKESWIKMNNGKVTDIDWHGYVHSAKRMKSPPAFDALDLSSGENNFFGDTQVNNKHFTPFSMQNSTASNAELASADVIKMVNAMNYVENKDAAQHWRIRVGSMDRDTSHAIGAMLAVKLKMAGKQVDYALPWGVGHSGDYDLDELFQWIDSITK